tara:strand:- start:537 stop:755 length:219 start_codon:yes stop_codon:yes gene_type:complete
MPPAGLEVVVLPSKRKSGRFGQGNQEREIRKEWEPRKKQWQYMESKAFSSLYLILGLKEIQPFRKIYTINTQ